MELEQEEASRSAEQGSARMELEQEEASRSAEQGSARMELEQEEASRSAVQPQKTLEACQCASKSLSCLSQMRENCSGISHRYGAVGAKALAQLCDPIIADSPIEVEAQCHQRGVAPEHQRVP
jgi:hypothetical protein